MLWPYFGLALPSNISLWENIVSHHSAVSQSDSEETVPLLQAFLYFVKPSNHIKMRINPKNSIKRFLIS